MVLEACFFKEDVEIRAEQADTTFNQIALKPGQSAHYHFTVTAPLKKDKYKLIFSVHTMPFEGSKNSWIIKFTSE